MMLFLRDHRARLVILLVTGLFTGLVGCNNFAGSSTHAEDAQAFPLADIQTIQRSSPRDIKVRLKGKVANRVPLVNGTAYELQDKTGRIWVVTQATVPNLGDEVTIDGQVRYQRIPLNNREESLYIEQQVQPQSSSTTVTPPK